MDIEMKNVQHHNSSKYLKFNIKTKRRKNGY